MGFVTTGVCTLGGDSLNQDVDSSFDVCTGAGVVSLSVSQESTGDSSSLGVSFVVIAECNGLLNPPVAPDLAPVLAECNGRNDLVLVAAGCLALEDLSVRAAVLDELSVFPLINELLCLVARFHSYACLLKSHCKITNRLDIWLQFYFQL